MEKEIYSKELKKEGWQNMNAILDKEMPIKKRRWLPFFLLIFIIASIGITYSMNKNNSSKNISKLNSEIKSKSNNNNLNEQVKKSPLSAYDNTETVKNTTPENQKSKSSTTKNIDNQKSKSSNINNKEHQKSNLNQQKNINTNLTKNVIASIEIHEIDSNNDETNKKIKPIDSKLYKISNIKSKKISLARNNNNEIFPKLSLDFVNFSNNSMSIFNPYIELKTYLHNYKKFDPKLGISIGNRFELSNRFFISLECSYTQAEIIIQDKNILSDEIFGGKSYSFTTKGDLSFDSNSGPLKSSVLELSLYEGYKFNNYWSAQLGGGIAFTEKLNNYLTDTNNSAESDVFEENGAGLSSEFKNTFKINRYSWFADLKASFSPNNRFGVSIGYKYYFNNSYILTEANSNIYRQKLTESIGNTGLYLGLQYQF